MESETVLLESRAYLILRASDSLEIEIDLFEKIEFLALSEIWQFYLATLAASLDKLVFLSALLWTTGGVIYGKTVFGCVNKLAPPQ